MHTSQTRSRRGRAGRAALAAMGAALAVLGIASCGEQWITEQRTVTVDVPTIVFRQPDAAAPASSGPGFIFLNLTVTTVTGFADSPAKQLVSITDMKAGQDYTSIAFTVSGRLKSISASGTDGTNEIASAQADDVEAADSDRYGGYSGFPGLTAFKLDWEAGASAAGNLRILPCPRPGASLAWDSGVTPSGGATDRAAALSSRQIAVQVKPLEAYSDGQVSYQLYWALADSDPSALSTADFSNTYLANPWDEWWTYGEVTGTSGKRIGDVTYVMASSGSQRVAGKADADGYQSALLDLSRESSATAGKWALVCAVMTRGGVSIPTRTLCIPIR